MSKKMRLNKLSIILGRKGSGKSYYTINTLIPAYRKAFPDKKILIYDTNDHMAYRFVPQIKLTMLKRWTGGGTYRLCEVDTDSALSAISEHMYNGLLICEDATKYINSRLQKPVFRSIIDSKQHNLDLVFQFHGFAVCPPEILRQCDILTLFRCDTPLPRKNMLAEYDVIFSAYEKVQSSRDKYPFETVTIL